MRLLSIIITHYKSPVALKLCLQSIADTLDAIPHEVFVADSEAQPETADLMRHDFPDATYLPHQENVGYARLVNAGLSEASGDPMLIMNADTVLTAGAVETLMRYLDEHGDVGMVGPRLEYMNGEHQPSAFRYYTPFTIIARRTPIGKTAAGRREVERFTLKDAMTEPIMHLDPMPVDWIMGSVMLIRRSAFDAVGKLDTRYFMYMEDVDWCRRFWEANWKVVWMPEARVVHVHGQGSKKRGAVLDMFTNRLTQVHFRSAMKYFKKFGLKAPRYGV